MAHSLRTAQALVGAGMLTLLVAGGCYYDKFEKVNAVADGSGGSGSGGDNQGGENAGGDSGSGGSISGGKVLAVEDVYFTRQGDGIIKELFDNDGGTGLRVVDSSDADPTRPTSLDGDNFKVSEAGVLNFTPHPDFWGTYRATYTIEDEKGEQDTGTILVHVEPDEIKLATVASGYGGFVVDGDANDALGFSMAGIRDFNGDGKDDFLLGAPGPLGADGRVALIFGSEDIGPLDLSQANDNVQIYAGDGVTKRAGISVSTAGNINNDLFHDIIVGATGDGQDGRAYVIYGLGNPAGADKTFKDAPTSGEGFTLSGLPGSQLGRGVTGGGNLNGDAFDDVAVFSQDGNGTLYGITGTATGEVSSLATLTYNSNWLQSPRPLMVGDMFGNDDRAEIMIGARTSANAFMTLLRGKTGLGGANQWPADANFTAAPNDGFKSNAFGIALTPPESLFSPSTAYARAFTSEPGTTVAYCSPIEDCLITSYAAPGGFDLNQGRLITGFTADPPRVGGGGNVNNDAFDDLVFAEGTKVYVLWGSADFVTTDLDITDIDEEGFSIDPGAETVGQVTILGDINDDGIDDLAVSVPSFDGGKGRVYVIFGTITD